MNLLQVAFEIVDHFLVKVRPGVSSGDMVIFVGEKEHVEMLVRFNECPAILDGVLKMHVVISRSMYQQQVAFQSAGE